MTNEEKFDVVLAFCYKHESLIDDALEGSDLWALRELCDAFDAIDQVQTAIWMDTIESVKIRLINAMLHITDRWSNEHDIQLECAEMSEEELILDENR